MAMLVSDQWTVHWRIETMRAAQFPTHGNLVCEVKLATVPGTERLTLDAMRHRAMSYGSAVYNGIVV
jgi:hypothetical protein